MKLLVQMSLPCLAAVSGMWSVPCQVPQSVCCAAVAGAEGVQREIVGLATALLARLAAQPAAVIASALSDSPAPAPAPKRGKGRSATKAAPYAADSA